MLGQCVPSAAVTADRCVSAAMEPFSKRPRVEGPGAAATPAEEVITFHLLKKDGDGNVVIESNGNFPPEMSHQ